MTNPLLQPFTLPPFSQIKPEHIEPAITQLLSDNLARIEALLQQANFTWDNLITPLEALDDRLERIWSPIRHMHATVDNPALRKAYNACLPKLTAYATQVSQNRALCAAYQAIHDAPNFTELSVPQRKTITDALRDFHLAGVDLEADEKKQFQTLQTELSQLTSTFSQNVLDATNHWHLKITDEEQLAGLPDHAKAQIKENDWQLTLDFPCYHAVVTYADDRNLREQMYTAFCTRATQQSGSEWDNTKVIEKILALRQQLAQLLKFNNYAEYSLATKMAESTKQVNAFLSDLVTRAKPQAEKELETLKAFAKEHGLEDFQAWDIAYYSEKLRQQAFNISDSQLRPYFPIDQVLAGMFTITHRLYGVTIKEESTFDHWHPDVRFFSIFDENQTLRGQFYCDLYARKNKRDGAWMDECVQRRLDGEQVIQTPVAYLTCNFTPATKGKPALLNHEEVLTLFHEFGHGLHHMLTKINYPAVSGINGVPWDAVELPSQFFENWCWQHESLNLFATHYQTGKPMPQALFDNLLAAKNFQSAMAMIRQLEFSLFDFTLHEHPDKGAQATLDAIRKQVAVINYPKFNRFQNSFSHIFAGGYAAGYYSYKWAEVLSADAFSKFEENGIFDQQTGQEFLCNILEKGGSEEPMVLFKAFRGREPTIDALLQHSGIK